MIKKFKLFEKFSSPIYYNHKDKSVNVDEKTIRVDGPNDRFYVIFYFDEQGRLDYIDNKWDIMIPEWYGFSVNIIEIKSYFSKRYGFCDVYYVIKREAEKYNL